MSELGKLTDEELSVESNKLENEKIRRDNIEIEKWNDILEKHVKAVSDNINGLLACVPQHDRTSCSDENPNNTERCVRCDLLNIKNSGYNSDVCIDITTERRTKQKKKRLKVIKKL